MPIHGRDVLLHSFSIRRYRSLKRTGFDPHPELSVLIGPNGSGKTNLLHAIQLLRISASQRLREEQPPRLANRCNLAATFAIGKRRIGYRATMVFTASERNRDEVITAHEGWNLRDFGGEDSWREIPRPFFDPRFQQHFYSVRTPSGHRVIRRNFAPGVFPNIKPSEIDVLRAVHSFKSSIKYYSASQFTNPSRCPSSFEIEGDNRVIETYADRGPHFSFVSNLFQTYKNHRDLYERYLGIVGRSGIGLIDSIRWKPITLSTGTVDVQTGGKIVRRRKKRILIVPIVSLRRIQLSFNQLSEGTFRTLALLYYLVTDPSGLLLVEEPEVCVHHGLLNSVIQAIKSYSVRKQIIISTHSELVLDSVKPANVFSVMHQAVRGTTVRPLSRSMSSRDFVAMKDYLATAGSLGEYWTHGGIEK